MAKPGLAPSVELVDDLTELIEMFPESAATWELLAAVEKVAGNFADGSDDAGVVAMACSRIEANARALRAGRRVTREARA